MNLLFQQVSIGIPSPSVAVNIVSFLLVIAIILIARKMFKDSKGLDSIDAFFTEGFIHKLKVIALISTFTECIGLMIIAFTLRNVDPFNAVMRFTTAGFFELAFTYLFINTSGKLQDNIIKRVLADGKIDLLEILWVFPYLVLVSLLFVAFSWPTYFIAMFYYHSTGALNMYFDSTSILPWEQWRIEILGGRSIPIEPGALFMIYVTPLISLAQIIATPIFKITARWNEIHGDDEDYDDDDDDDDWDDDDDVASVDSKMTPVLESLGDILNINPTRLMGMLKNLLGESGEASSTHPDIINKTKTSEQIKEGLIDLFLGPTAPSTLNVTTIPDDLEGINGYTFLKNYIKNTKSNELQKTLYDYDDASRALGSATPADKAALKKTADDLNIKVGDIRKEIRKLKKLQDEIKSKLEGKCRDSGMYPGKED